MQSNPKGIKKCRAIRRERQSRKKEEWFHYQLKIAEQKKPIDNIKHEIKYNNISFTQYNDIINKALFQAKNTLTAVHQAEALASFARIFT